jgi:hypothetical protein
MALISVLALHDFSANTNPKVFQESKVDTAKATFDAHVNTRTSSSILIISGMKWRVLPAAILSHPI